MSSPKTWTAAELERLTPAERHEIFEQSIVTDLDDVPTEFRNRIETRARRAHRGARRCPI